MSCLLFHISIVSSTSAVFAAQNVAVPIAVEEMVTGVLPFMAQETADEQLVAGVTLPSSHMLRNIVI